MIKQRGCFSSCIVFFNRRLHMPFITLNEPQVSFLERYLRGTNRTLTEAQARSTYGIQNLRARMTEFRKAGLKVSLVPTTAGHSAYRVSARDVNGSRSMLFIR